MGRASASVTVPGLASEAEALWYDPVRWAAWIDDFAHLAELSPDWPASGRRVWNSPPEGRGRVLEVVESYEPRVGQVLAVEDARLRGVERVRFSPGPDAVAVTLELDYQLKAAHALTWLVDALVVRRGVAASLRRTLLRFSRERRADTESDAVARR